MKTPLALLAVAALALVTAPARGDQAGAREMEDVAHLDRRIGVMARVRLLLASGAKLGEHKQSLIEAAREPEIRGLLEAAE